MRSFSTLTDLLPHQREAIEKVLPTRVSGLFMDMGTGKSRTTIELVKIRAGRIDRAVWCCPVSLKETIKYEILKHTDCTSDDICVFGDRTNTQNMPRDCLWYIVGIESLSSSNRVTLALNSIITEQTFVIVDESSYIKGHNSTRTLRITALAERARYRSILTGTPISQGIVDLYSQMTFLSPKILGYKSFYTFANNHLEYHPDYPGLIVRCHNIPYLAAKIKPYVYQCTKDECLSIPSKIYNTVFCEMTDEQEREYAAAKEVFIEEQLQAEDYEKPISQMAVFKLFTTLQTIVCGMVRVKEDDKPPYTKRLSSNRISSLLGAVASVPAKEKVLIWAKYVASIEEIADALRDEYGNNSVALFYGGLSPKEREKELGRFTGPARFLIATQSCGGHGLNLQFCCYEIFYANGFKYSERLQAEDRCHRHGQRRKVTYIDVYTYDSIDQRIEAALAKKGDALKSFREEVERIKRDKSVTNKEKFESLKDMVNQL